ncbi:hypothetical protein [Blastococcus sp. SYSU DS0828]
MTTSTSTPTATATSDPAGVQHGSPVPAVAGIGALGAFAAAAVVLGDPLAGAGNAQEAAAALGNAPVTLAATLLGGYALLATAVAGALARRLGRSGETAAVRLLPVLGAGHVLLLAATFTSLAAAVVVGTRVLGGGVTPTGAETGLIVMNVVHPMAAWVGAGFLIAVAVAARGTSRALTIVSAVFAAGLLLPPVGWAVTYLMAFWFAGVGVWLWRRH